MGNECGCRVDLIDGVHPRCEGNAALCELRRQQRNVVMGMEDPVWYLFGYYPCHTLIAETWHYTSLHSASNWLMVNPN